MLAIVSGSHARGGTCGCPGASQSRSNQSTAELSSPRSCMVVVTTSSTVPRSSPTTTAPARVASSSSTASITSAS
jgi:hypothetical protein